MSLKRSVFLIGMMGCGKSTMALELSRMIGCPRLDLDDEIVSFEGKSIPEIFSESGDAGFRLCETAALRRACCLPPTLIATGGGIVTRPENVSIMREHGSVIWLNRSLEDMIATVRQDTRPNLAGDKEERMRTLFAVREPLYRAAAHLEFKSPFGPKEAAKLLLEDPLFLELL